MLAVDDVQWLDVPTAEALKFALRRLDGSPVALLATLRTTGVPRPSLLDVVEVAGHRGCASDHSTATRCTGCSANGSATCSPQPCSVGSSGHRAGTPSERSRSPGAWLEGGVPESGDESLPVPDDVRELINVRLRRLPVATREELLEASALTDPALPLIDPEPLGSGGRRRDRLDPPG